MFVCFICKTFSKYYIFFKNVFCGSVRTDLSMCPVYVGVRSRTSGCPHTARKRELFGSCCCCIHDSLGTTSYQFVFGKSCHLLVESERKAYWAIKTLNFDLKPTEERRFLQFVSLIN